MKLAKIKGYLPDTAKSIEHPRAIALKELLDSLAKNEGTTVNLFDVSDKGTVVFGLADDKALEKITAQFGQEKDIVVTETTMIAFQREQNQIAQQKVDKMRAKKEQDEKNKKQ